MKLVAVVYRVFHVPWNQCQKSISAECVGGGLIQMIVDENLSQNIKFNPDLLKIEVFREVFSLDLDHIKKI